jgi:hypothetical protein
LNCGVSGSIPLPTMKPKWPPRIGSGKLGTPCDRMQRDALTAAAASDDDAGRKRCTPVELVLPIDATREFSDAPPQPAARRARTATAVEPKTIDFSFTVRTEVEPPKAAVNRA